MFLSYTPQMLSAFVGLAFFIAGCASKGKEADKELKAQKRQPATAIQVRTAEAVRKPFAFRVTAVGKIEAQQHTEVFAKREGVIAKIYVSNGQTIAQGQTIAELDKTEFELQVRKAKANLALKQVQYQDRIREYNHNFTSEKDLTPELRERFRATSGLSEAELALQEAELNLSYCKITAPFAGKIADLKMKQGNRLSLGNTLCIIYSAHALEAVTEVLESQAGKLQIGQKAEIATIADEKFAYTATISEINPKVTANGLVRVKLAINPAGTQTLLQGMNVRVQITAPQAESVVVPKEAIVMRSGKKVVFSVEAGEAKWHYVVTGAENQTEVAIAQGLEAGKQIVVSNNLQLVHDSPVVVVK